MSGIPEGDFEERGLLAAVVSIDRFSHLPFDFDDTVSLFDSSLERRERQIGEHLWDTIKWLSGKRTYLQCGLKCVNLLNPETHRCWDVEIGQKACNMADNTVSSLKH